jgi:hypothetical protein
MIMKKLHLSMLLALLATPYSPAAYAYRELLHEPNKPAPKNMVPNTQPIINNNSSRFKNRKQRRGG